MSETKHILVCGNCHQDASRGTIVTLLQQIGRRPGVTFGFEEMFRRYLGEAVPELHLPVEEGAPSLILCFGGDGTLLHSGVGARGRCPAPIMGINTGHLGYLTAMTLAEAMDHVDDIVEGRYRTETRSMIAASCMEARGEEVALNEVAILKKDTASMITVDIDVDGRHLATVGCDGLVVSTPTGSTAYNLSAGGPVVDPEAKVMIITPLAPHSLTMRPLVVSDTSCITIRTTSRAHDFRLSVDGRSQALPSGTAVTVRRSEQSVQLAFLKNRYYIDTLRAKLLLGR